MPEDGAGRVKARPSRKTMPEQKQDSMTLLERLDNYDRILSDLQQRAAIASSPPAGFHRVTNLYVNDEGQLLVEYDDGG